MAPEAGPLEGQRCAPTSAGRASCPERPTWSRRRATAERERPAVLCQPSEVLRGRSVSWSLSHGSRSEWSFGDSAGSHVLLCDLERIVPVNGRDQVVATVQDEITNEAVLRKMSGKRNRERSECLRASVAVARFPEKQGEPAERVEPSRASLHGRGRFCSFGGDFMAEMDIQELPATLKMFFLPYLDSIPSSTCPECWSRPSCGWETGGVAHLEPEMFPRGTFHLGTEKEGRTGAARCLLPG